MVKVNLANLVVVTLLAAFGLFVLKWSAPFVPFQGYRDLVGGI